MKENEATRQKEKRKKRDLVEGQDLGPDKHKGGAQILRVALQQLEDIGEDAHRQGLEGGEKHTRGTSAPSPSAQDGERKRKKRGTRKKPG